MIIQQSKKLFLLPYLFILFAGAGNERPKDYLLIEFGSVSVDKAITPVAFSMESFNEIEIGLTNTYVVDKCEYLSICDAIRESKNIRKLEVSGSPLYKFWIVRNGKSELFGTSTIDETEDVFKIIAQEIKNKKIKKSVSAVLMDKISQIRDFFKIYK